jgi:hypothetical protein
MIVSHIEDNGYLRFDVVGSVPPNLTYAQRVVICTPQGPRTGVVGSKPGHIAFRQERELGTTVPPVDALFIDVGASAKSEAQRMGIEPGQQVTWDRDLAWLGAPSTGLVTGRSLDDKVGCLAVLEAMRALRAAGRGSHATAIRRRCPRGSRLARRHPGRGSGQADLCIGIDATVSQAGFGSGIGLHPARRTRRRQPTGRARAG